MENNQNAQTQGKQQSQQTQQDQTTQVQGTQTQPQAPQQSQTPSAPSLSEEQVGSLKESITKDVEGKVSEQVSKSVIQKIGEAFGLTKKEEQQLPTDAEKLQELIDQKFEEKWGALEQQAEQEEQQTETQRQERINGIIGTWYNQYNQLARIGKVPAIKNANDESDEGVKARRQFILAIGKMIDENKKQGIEYVPSISDVLVAYPNILKEPPGADLPISGNTQNLEDKSNFTHKEIRSKSIEELARG